MTSDDAVFDKLPPLLRDEQTLEHASDDWGHRVALRPYGVLRPTTIDHIQAAAREFSLVARGRGHSHNGEAQSDGGVVLDMNELNTIHEISRDHVVVDAGARWSEVLAATLPQGLTPPVLTDYLELSVGGTLSVGGIGGASGHHGLQTDNVIELEVITPGGAHVACSPQTNTELFDAVRAGNGDHGVIARATLKLIPAHPRARRLRLHYRDLLTALADQRTLLADGRFDYLEGQAQLDQTGEWDYVIEAVSFYTAHPVTPPKELHYHLEESDDLRYFDFLNRMAPQEELLRQWGAWYQPHPWIDVFLPDSAADGILTDTMSNTGVHDIGETGLVLIYPVSTNWITTSQVRLPDEPVMFLFALLRTAPAGDTAALDRMLAGNSRLRARTLTAGGTIYREG